MGRGRNRLKNGWVSIEKRRSPHRWVAHWYLNSTYESNGVVRYRQGSHVLGLRTKDDLRVRDMKVQIRRLDGGPSNPRTDR